MSPPLDQMTKTELQAHLRELRDEHAERRQFEIAGLAKGAAAALMALVGALVTLGAGTYAFLSKGEGFISGMHLVVIVFILVGGLILYFSFVFGRTAKLKMEISKTKKLLELSSGDKTK